MSTDSKAIRRYQAGVERALGLFDTTHEWADYIAFLGRLYKALYAHPDGGADIPLKKTVARHLSQCLNPALPSGVHQKALELYELIFSLIGTDGLGRDLSLYLPGLSYIFTFASLTVRPLFLSLFSGHVLKLSASILRAPLKAIILALLSGLEEETSEDFETTSAILDELRQKFQADLAEGLFWQSFFLASITCPNKRPGVLMYLARNLPRFGPTTISSQIVTQHPSPTDATATVLHPEPGLMIRCFATGLQDEQTLIQRTFLDLLVTHLPLNAHIFSDQVLGDDLDLLVSAAVTVVLRKDMSLNRRLWTWFLGTEKAEQEATATKASISEDPPRRKQSSNGDIAALGESSYATTYGLPPLIRAFAKTISKSVIRPSERARPFRIALSLMDRWEIGGPLVKSSFVALLENLQHYQSIATSQEAFDEVYRSANAFFDGVESHLIWTQIFSLLNSGNTDLVAFILSHFGIQEEEMLVLHVPLNALAVSSLMVAPQTLSNGVTSDDLQGASTASMVAVLKALIGLAHNKAFDQMKSDGPPADYSDCYEAIRTFYVNDTVEGLIRKSPFSGREIGEQLLRNLSMIFLARLESDAFDLLELTSTFIALILRVPYHDLFQELRLAQRMLTVLKSIESKNVSYSVTASIASLVTSLTAHENSGNATFEQGELLEVTDVLARHLWHLLASHYSQHHVEVAHLLWDLHKVSHRRRVVESAIIHQMVALSDPKARKSETSMPRFAVLWIHLGSIDKSQNYVEALTMLRGPLLLLIDSTDVSCKEWLQSLSSLIPIYSAILQDFDISDEHTQISLRRLCRIFEIQSTNQWQQFSHEQDLAGRTSRSRLLGICTEVLKKEECDIPTQVEALSLVRLIYLQSVSLTEKDDGELLEIVSSRIGQHIASLDLRYTLLDTLVVVLGKRTASQDLLACLLQGVKTVEPTLIDKWISTICHLVPLYGDAIFQIVIGVTEVLCERFRVVFADLTMMYGADLKENHGTDRLLDHSPAMPITTTQVAANPEKLILNLLAGLEYILARAHERLADREGETDSTKGQDQPTRLFGTIIAGNQDLSESNKLRSTLVNDRLTVVLCFQDCIKLCFKIWSWSSWGQTGPVEKRASFSYISSKMRGKSRRILENLLEAETQECLETMIELWVKAVKHELPLDHGLVLRLLQTLNGARPRVMMPATFSAIYNRTNPIALEKRQRSTLSTDLTPLETLAFLIEYTSALEDDLLDEIWTDCTSFVREVLSNPMPHRQILLRLLEFVAVLCGKMENTNFGEESKMRRELGDLALRLLTAIFTVKPGGLDPAAQTAPADARDTLSTQHPNLGPGNATQVLSKNLPRLSIVLADSDRMTTALSGIMLNITGPFLRSKHFHQNASADFFSLLQAMSKTPGGNKLWKKDILDAFNDSKFFHSPARFAKEGWLPLIRQLSTLERAILPEHLSRLTVPTTAGLMFGVGASAARTEADKKAQLHLRRIALIVMANESDTYAASLTQTHAKVEELLTATHSSSPSSGTRADVFILLRALILRCSASSLGPFWPTIDAELQAALQRVFEDQDPTYNMSARLQAAKLLDLLLLIKPDEFQMHEWLFVTDTVDAIYPPNGWTSSALVDRVGREALKGVDGVHTLPVAATRRPWLCSDVSRTTPPEDIDAKLLRPFCSQLSIHAFEDVYGMQKVDLAACENDILADLFDMGSAN